MRSWGFAAFKAFGALHSKGGCILCLKITLKSRLDVAPVERKTERIDYSRIEKKNCVFSFIFELEFSGKPRC